MTKEEDVVRDANDGGLYMTKKETVHRYILDVEKMDWGHVVKLVRYDQTKGTYFEVYRSSEDGWWYWKLYLYASPHGPAARSARGYKTRQTAQRTIRTAFKAMQWVVQK